MTIHEAIQSCKEGNFVSNKWFDSSQSMHMYKHTLYYEDGANLSASSFNILEESWAIDGWFVKYDKDKVDKEKLKTMHENSKGRMLDSGSYEDCINK